MMHFTGPPAQQTRAAVGSSSCRRPLHALGDALAQCIGILVLAFFMAILFLGVFAW